VRRRQSVAVAVATLGLVLALWTMRGRSSTAARASELAVDPPGTNAASTVLPPPHAPPGASERAPVVLSQAHFAEVLTQYRHDAVYPPGSRPLDEGARYKLHWNDAIVSELPFTSALSYHFAADRHHVTYGEPLTSWIEVWTRGDEAKRVPLRVRSAWVMTTSGANQGRTIELGYHDDGRDGDAVAGDLRYSNRFVPAEHEELRVSRDVQLYADVVAAGVERPMLRDFTYAPRPVLEVTRVSDALVNGSLVVSVDCEVFEDGLYTFEANAVSAAGEEPIAYVDQSFPLHAGKQQVQLSFFGRVFHDRGLSGPYLVRDLHGFRRDLDGAEGNVWWSQPGAHATAAYDVAQFSDAEWDAPEKQEKLRRLEAAAAGR
jgi:hypothetical protein